MDKVAQDLLNKTSAFLQQAAHILGQTAIHVYEVMVRQQAINGISEILITIVVVMTFFIGIKVVYKPVLGKLKHDDWEGFEYLIAFLVLAAIVGIMWIASATVADGIGHIINPEYYAIEQIFNTVTNQNNNGGN